MKIGDLEKVQKTGFNNKIITYDAKRSISVNRMETEHILDII